MRKRRILYIIPSIEGGGAENQMRLLANQFADDGDDVWVIFNHEHQSPETIFNPNVNYKNLNISNNYSVRIFAEYYKLIKRLSPDIVQTWIMHTDIIIGLISVITRFVWIVREPSDRLSSKKTIKGWLRKFLVSRFAQALVGNSERGLLYWKHSHSNLHLIRNGYPMREFDHFFPKMTKEFDCEIIYIGRLESLKNIVLLMETLETVSTSLGRTIRLTIIGKGSLQKEIETVSARLTLAIKILNYISNKRELFAYLSRSDIYCSFSSYEGMPNVLVEAGLCRTFIMASDIPSHRELLGDRYPFLLNLNDLEGLKEVLKKGILLEADEKRRYIEKNYAAFTEYDIKRISKKYRDLYDHSIQNKERF